MNRLAHRDDCYIDRDHPDWPASAVLFDSEGEVINRFDEDWTDDQIWAALEFANRAFRLGIEIGEQRRAGAIRRLLGAATQEEPGNRSIDEALNSGDGVYRP